MTYPNDYKSLVLDFISYQSLFFLKYPQFINDVTILQYGFQSNDNIYITEYKINKLSSYTVSSCAVYMLIYIFQISSSRH